MDHLCNWYSELQRLEQMRERKLFVVCSFMLLSFLALSKENGRNFIDALDLNIIGRAQVNQTFPYHRVNVENYEFTETETRLMKCSSGLAVLFKTNSTSISIETEYAYCGKGINSTGIALHGFDLYIKKDGKWIYAASNAPKNITVNMVYNIDLINHMSNELKECMLYLPMYSEVKTLKIRIDEDAEIIPLESPFKSRIAVFGSSFTQGAGISRSGMSYPMQFMRNTELQILNLGCSGNAKLQSSFAKVLADLDLDAIILDVFSNPTLEQIEERLFPFIEMIHTAHPDIPIIFMQTIYRAGRNFNLERNQKEQNKIDRAKTLMHRAIKKYSNVYYIEPDLGIYQDFSVDGSHLSDMGYYMWAQSIEKPILDILAL